MLIDSALELSDSQAVTSTAISTNVIDAFSAIGGGAQIGPNAPYDLDANCLFLVVQTAVACTDVGSDATLTITLETDSAVGLGSSTVLFQSAAIPFASFSPAGAIVLQVGVPRTGWKRYLGVRYTIANGPLTAGAFDAFITTNVQKNKVYKTSMPLVQ